MRPVHEPDYDRRFDSDDYLSRLRGDEEPETDERGQTLGRCWACDDPVLPLGLRFSGQVAQEPRSCVGCHNVLCSDDCAASHGCEPDDDIRF